MRRQLQVYPLLFVLDRHELGITNGKIWLAGYFSVGEGKLIVTADRISCVCRLACLPVSSRL